MFVVVVVLVVVLVVVVVVVVLDIEEPGSESETLPTPKRARQQAALDSSDATPARDEGEDIALFARLGAQLRSPVPGQTPAPRGGPERLRSPVPSQTPTPPRGGPEQLWSPIAGSGPSSASVARAGDFSGSSPTLGALLLSTPAPAALEVTSSPTLGPLLVSTPAPSSSQPGAAVAWSPSPLHLPPLTSDDILSQGGPGSSPGARRAPRSSGRRR